MNELMKILGQTGQSMTFDQIRIQLASPAQILSWSYGEIKKVSYNSIRYAFLPAAEKVRLTKQLDARFVKFEAEIAALDKASVR